MSETERQPFGKLPESLGPGHYNYKKPDRKKSYHVSLKRSWI